MASAYARRAMPNRPDKITMFALYALEDVTAEALLLSNANDVRPISRTWAIRLALAVLHMRGLLPKDQAANFWDQMHNPGVSENTDAIRCYCRHRDLNCITDACFRRAGAFRGPGSAEPITSRKLRRMPPEPKPYQPLTNPIPRLDVAQAEADRLDVLGNTQAFPKPRDVNEGSRRRR